MLKRFWSWYEKHYVLTLAVTASLFLLQAFHLYWLFSDIISQRIFGKSFFAFPPQGLFVYVFIDYAEIPTHLSLTLIYLYQLRKGFKLSQFLYFLFLQIHWLHIFWITDEVVLQRLTHQQPVTFNYYLAWVAILVDYLEVPIMIDQIKKVYASRQEILAKLRAVF